MATSALLPWTHQAPVPEILARFPSLGLAIENARRKLQTKAKFETDQMVGNLSLILSDWCQERGINSIGWSSPNDRVAPQFALDMLGHRLTERLVEIKFEEFLERFAQGMIELAENERRSQ